MLFPSFLIITGGFLALALAMNKHYRDLTGQDPPHSRRRALRLWGSALLLLGFAGCGIARGWHFGPVWFTGLTAVAAFVVVAVVSLAPNVIRRTRRDRAKCAPPSR